MELIYIGKFYSRENVRWEVQLLRNQDYEPDSIGLLHFPGTEPLVFEWNEESKEVPLCGSTATLTVLSPGDRTYTDLYTDDPTAVRLDVYRNGTLYWSGCMDTEFYEEPYSQVENYEVLLTFSDFGVLDRLRYDLAGMQSLHDILQNALSRSNINYVDIDSSMVSSCLAHSFKSISLADLKVRSDNFYDEDGEAMSLRKVLEGIFQPLAMRMIQRDGRIWVYDLNGLYMNGKSRELRWMSDDQTLGVDKVYNDAKITWSTYAQSGNLLPEECWGDIETPANETALNTQDGGFKDGGVKYYSYHYSSKLNDWTDSTDCGFTIWTALDGRNAELGESKDRYTRFFKIVPQYDGTESEGIAIYWEGVQAVLDPFNPKHVTYYNRPYGWRALMAEDIDRVDLPLFRTTPIWAPPVMEADNLVLRIAIEMMMDPRFNPFEQAETLWAEGNIKFEEQDKWYDEFEKDGNFVYVPIMVKFQPDGSDDIYVWDNRDAVKYPVKYPITTLRDTYGRWVRYSKDAKTTTWGYLAYYDADDREKKCGVLGWKKNRPAINPHRQRLLSILSKAEAGQYIPYPNFGGGGGKLWMEVRGGGWMIAKSGQDLSITDTMRNLYSSVNWVLMKMPELEIMNSTQFDKAIDTDDVEYSAKLNEAAKEPIGLETVCGTCAKGVPTARGAYFNTKTGAQITELSRAGRTTQVEELLIGTLYSQFASRKTRLDGTVEIMSGGLQTYIDASQPDGTVLMMTGSVENVQDDTMEAVFVELRPDEYDKAGT